MSKKISICYLVFLSLVVFTVVSLTFSDIGALAQNTNSSTTTDESMQNDNANTNTGRRRRGRRGTRAGAAGANANANVSAEAAGQEAGANLSANLAGEATDLSGTYTGNIELTGGHTLSGPATLTITGNTFTLESGGQTHSGRVLASTTRGYTGAALYFTDITDTGTNTPLAVSVRARRSGNRLMLSPVPGARNSLTFGTAAERRRSRRTARPAQTRDANLNENANNTP